jgi:hypothetical protein
MRRSSSSGISPTLGRGRGAGLYTPQGRPVLASVLGPGRVGVRTRRTADCGQLTNCACLVKHEWDCSCGLVVVGAGGSRCGRWVVTSEAYVWGVNLCHPVTFCSCDFLGGSRIYRPASSGLACMSRSRASRSVHHSALTLHGQHSALRRGSIGARCAVGSGPRSIVGGRSIVEKQLGSHSRWSRWPNEVLLHAARVRRTA